MARVLFSLGWGGGLAAAVAAAAAAAAPLVALQSSLAWGTRSVRPLRAAQRGRCGSCPSSSAGRAGEEDMRASSHPKCTTHASCIPASGVLYSWAEARTRRLASARGGGGVGGGGLAAGPQPHCRVRARLHACCAGLWQLRCDGLMSSRGARRGRGGGGRCNKCCRRAVCLRVPPARLLPPPRCSIVQCRA